VHAIFTPVDDEGLANAEQHNSDLGNGKETPNRGLLHEIWCDQASESRAENEEKYTLDDHALFLIESEERGKHHERVNSSSWDHIGGVSEGDRPGKVIVPFVCAELFSSQPFRGGSVLDVEGLRPHSCEKVSRKQHCSSDQT